MLVILKSSSQQTYISLALGNQEENYLLQKEMIYLTATVIVAVPLVVRVFGISDIVTPSHDSWMALKKMKKKNSRSNINPQNSQNKTFTNAWSLSEWQWFQLELANFRYCSRRNIMWGYTCQLCSVLWQIHFADNGSTLFSQTAPYFLQRTHEMQLVKATPHKERCAA